MPRLRIPSMRSPVKSTAINRKKARTKPVGDKRPAGPEEISEKVDHYGNSRRVDFWDPYSKVSMIELVKDKMVVRIGTGSGGSW